MPYKNKEKQRQYQNKWAKNRREKWLLDNGPCVICGSWENLEVHHKDPTQKESHKIWTWCEERRLVELIKCEVRCSDCHNDAHTKHGPEDTLWCSKCQQFLPEKAFGKSSKKGQKRQYRWYCNSCRKSIGWN